jgi:hypothetical protein
VHPDRRTVVAGSVGRVLVHLDPGSLESCQAPDHDCPSASAGAANRRVAPKAHRERRRNVPPKVACPEPARQAAEAAQVGVPGLPARCLASPRAQEQLPVHWDEPVRRLAGQARRAWLRAARSQELGLASRPVSPRLRARRPPGPVAVLPVAVLPPAPTLEGQALASARPALVGARLALPLQPASSGRLLLPLL